MSLQIWLPLTKDLRNQGLNNVTATNSGSTYSSTGGKLGGCYSFDGVDDRIYANDISLSNSAMSACCWVKFNNLTSSDYPYIFALGSNTSGPGIQIGLSVWKSDTKIHLVGNGSEPSSGYTPPTNTWIHLCITINGSTTKLYVNGVLTNTQTNSNSPKTQTCLCLGARPNSTSGAGSAFLYPMSGYINDFRLYDNCLTEQEIKEIAKGLILHYPLNRNGWGQENLATCTTSQYNIAASTSNYNYFWINSSTLEPNTTYTFSAEVEVSDNIMQCTIYNYTSSGNSGSSISTFPADGKRHSWTFTTTTTGLGLIGYAGKSGATTNHSAIYRNIKVEKGSVATPYIPRSNETLYTTMSLSGTTEYDCSGFCNNGIKNNLPTYLSDTAKYNVSTYLDGVNQTIQLPNLSTLIPDGIFTFSIWFKKETDKWSSKSWETIFGGPSGFEFQSKSGSTNSPLLYAYSWGKGTKVYTLDEWHHFVMVRTTEGTTFYLDGEQAFTGTAGSIPSGNYFLGSWSTTSSQNYKGFMGDARIYATALSADDVLALYNKKI